ncbi:MAG: SGNH/GDSL hydrolase family protein [Ignavibacteria bacterium]|nr:MAG: SGNH/GDSL hydrolase family protein [Ignavibacteria bacterium]
MKKYNKNIKYLIVALVISVFFFSGCDEDDVVVTPPPPFSPGSADFSMYVAIGNSITAGFQSNALSERDQKYSFTGMLSKQFQRTSFEQPLIKDPGIGDPGRLRLLNLAPTIVIEPSVDPTDPSSNLNIALLRPYNNLGIPAAILFDMVDETDFGAKSVARGNPFFALILRDAALGSSVINQAKTLQPTFITAWIGNNDVLGYATSGGTSGTNADRTLPTELPVFTFLYTWMLDSLAANGADIVVANIPDVSTLPFFTTVGPILSGSVPWGIVEMLQAGLPGKGIIYESKTGFNLGLPFNVGFADSIAVRNGTTLFTLIGQTYASLLGQPTGKFYTDNGFPALPPGIDTTKAFGFHPQNPFPDALVLDPAEITIAKTAVNDFNGIISAEASTRDIAVVDVNSFLKSLLISPIPVPGIGVFTASFIAGGTFSYDGVHPSSRGYGLIANEWIKVINQKFGANVSLVDLNSLPGMPMGKISAGAFPEYPAGFYNNMVRMITGDSNWPVK